MIVTSRALGVEEVLDACERVRASDEAVVQRREARRRERLQRREVLAQARREELEELSRGRDVLQPVPAERPERARRGAARRPQTSRVACETTTCSPCAAAQMRAAMTTSMPT